MPSKKKPAKTAKKGPAKKPVKKAARPAPKKTKAASKRVAPKKASKPSKPSVKALPRGLPERAKRMAMFSQQVVKEEEAPIAVRTFNEARAGVEESKQLDIRSGQVKPVAGAKPVPTPTPPRAASPAPTPSVPTPRPPPQPQPEADEDLEAEIARDLEEMDMGETRSQPKLEPLAGQASVPKRTNPLDEEFKVGASAKKGKKGAPPTKEDLGKIELRMQRGSKDEAIAHASPDYLQRSFNKAAQKGKVAATSAAKGSEEHKVDEFEVAMDKGQKRLDAALSDFGDIEIAQQTRRGSKKVGKLDTDESDEETQ
jgi:hypothetical protein